MTHIDSRLLFGVLNDKLVSGLLGLVQSYHSQWCALKSAIAMHSVSAVFEKVIFHKVV